MWNNKISGHISQLYRVRWKPIRETSRGNWNVYHFHKYNFSRQFKTTQKFSMLQEVSPLCLPHPFLACSGSGKKVPLCQLYRKTYDSCETLIEHTQEDRGQSKINVALIKKTKTNQAARYQVTGLFWWHKSLTHQTTSQMWHLLF